MRASAVPLVVACDALESSLVSEPESVLATGELSGELTRAMKWTCPSGIAVESESSGKLAQAVLRTHAAHNAHIGMSAASTCSRCAERRTWSPLSSSSSLTVRRSWAICDAMVDVSSMLSAVRRNVRNASHPYYRTQPHATAINVDGLARLRGTGGSCCTSTGQPTGSRCGHRRSALVVPTS